MQQRKRWIRWVYYARIPTSIATRPLIRERPSTGSMTPTALFLFAMYVEFFITQYNVCRIIDAVKRDKWSSNQNQSVFFALSTALREAKLRFYCKIGHFCKNFVIFAPKTNFRQKRVVETARNQLCPHRDHHT